MKNLPNIETSIAESGRKLTHADLLKACINQTPHGGFDVPTMRARLRVADAVEKALATPGSEIALEDADYAAACVAVREMRWGGMHRDILNFCEAFNS